MSRAAVDSSIILDILLDDPEFADDSLALLHRHFSKGALVICPVVYAECAACLDPPSHFTLVAREMNLSYQNFDSDICTLAARMWQSYRRRGGLRRRVLADFLIGAHAQTRTDLLLARDRGFYRDYFADLRIERP